MAQSVSIKNLSVIFGTEKQKKEVLELLDSHSPLDIRKKTGATVAVKNVDFEIEEGELFVIVGLSGSGKSSFIRALNLLNRPATGTIEVGGRSLTEMSKQELREYRRNDVSMVFQHFGLLSHRTVLGNVEYPLEVQKLDKESRQKRSMEAIKLVGLDGWEHHMPNQLSGGMRQRVGLARALTNDPELLLMDEPYSALDPLIRREMQNELLKLEDTMDRTIIFITHDMNEAFRMGDRIALLKDAELVQLGTPEEFFKKPANQYVKDFIADVDKTRILKVRNIMRKPPAIAYLKDSRKDVLDIVEKNDMKFIYVTDKKRYFKGFITREKLKKSKANTIDKLVENDDTMIYRNDYLQDAWGKLSEATFDLPVVDGKGRLRGVLNHDNIVDALAKK